MSSAEDISESESDIEENFLSYSIIEKPEQSVMDPNETIIFEQLFPSEQRYKAQYEAIDIEENFAPRDYQIELYQKSRNKNSIIFLETGKGKTLIALMHIYNHIKKHGVNNVKIIFLANTIQLVEQQAKYIRKNLYNISAFMENNNLCENNFDFDIKQLKEDDYLKRFVIPIHSKVQTQDQDQEIDVNGWKEERWNEVKSQSTILIMMGQMLLNALRRGYLKLPYFSLIIFDECHHTRFKHSYRLILKEFLEDQTVTKFIKNSDKVHIIGLTASPVISVDLNKAITRSRIDGRSIEIQLLQLAQNMHSKYVFEDENQKQIHEQISQPHYIYYEEQMGISEYYIPEQEKITEIFLSLMTLIKDYMSTNIKYEMQLFLQQLKHYMIQHGLAILKELGTYSFLQFLLQIRLDVTKIPQMQRSLSDTQIMKRIYELLSKSIEELKDLDDFTKMENLSQKFGNLIKYLQEEKAKDEDQFKQQKLIIFVDQKIIAKYLYETLQRLGFECNFVVGTGNKASGSLQQEILAQRNVKIQLENLHKIDIQQLAIELFNSYEPTELDPENDNFDNDNSVANQLAKDQLVELQEGIKKLGKHLDQTDIEAKEQQRIIKLFREDTFNILISTNVTEEGFDIPDCNSIIIYGKVTTLKQFIQKTGRARKGDKKIVMVLEQSERETIDIKVKVLQKTINCIKQKIYELTDKDYTNPQEKIKQLQLEIDHNFQFTQQEYYEKSLVRNSLALLNTNWAVEILSNYANLFRYDHKDTGNFIKGVFYSFTQTPAMGWRCVIILPKNSSERYFIGKLQSTKDKAKASAAYEAVLKLRKALMLTDDLRPIKGAIQYRGDNNDDVNMQDPQYHQIVNETIIFKYEDKVDLTQKFFPFKLDVFRIDLKRKLNVYKFTFFHDNQSQIEDKQYNHLNEQSNYPTILGLIHNLELDKMSFSVGNEVRIEKVNEIELTEQDYQYYYKVHLFLLATTEDWDIQYYSNISKDPIKMNSHMFQNKKTQPFDDIDNQNTYALLVLLKKTEEDNYVLNDQISQEIIDYQSKMAVIYTFLNSIKEKKEQNKTRKEQQIRLNDSTIKMNRWDKLIPDGRVAKILASDQFKGFVVQNISENFHLGKMVILERNEQEIEQSMQQIDESIQQENEKKLKKEKDRRNALRGIIDDKFEDEISYNAPVLRKYLKIPIKQFKKIVTSPQQKSGNHVFYGAEFYKFPLNLGTCFKLRILISSIFPKLRDFIAATTLKEHQHLTQAFFNQKQLAFRNQQLGIYNYTVMNNIIIEDQGQILTYFQRFKQGTDENLSSLIEQFQQNILHKIQNQIFQHQQVNHQNYFLDQIDQSLIYQCFQSQIYNQEDKSNYQVLEFLGDAILKLLSSMEVFVEYPFVNENILHTSRAKIISNENLRRISIINRFYEYTLCYKFEFWPQGFISNNLEQPINDDKKDLNRYHAKLNDQIIDKLPYNYQNIPDKVHSDVVEALNGAFMKTYNDIDACQTFLFQIGVLKYPDTQLILQYSQTRQINDGLLGQVLEQLENILQYKFNDQSLLVQALTHPSFLDFITFYLHQTRNDQIARYKHNQLNIDFQNINYNLITEDLIKDLNQYQARADMAYERLEFLGDAVLDAVVVDWLVKQFPNDYAEDLSLKKQCVVCNKALALATLSLGLEKYLFHPTLHNPLHDHNKVLQRIRERYDQYFNDISTMYTQEPLVKILGDVFESIVGAIFVDSEFNYKLIQEVIINLLKPFMEHFTSPNQIQKNPQDRLNRYFKNNNQGQMELIMTDADMVNGESEYVLKSQKSDQIFKRVRASGEKEAREKILEYLSRKGEI